ncbi:MAG: histone-like protein [Candidatus Heimdallarchaeota archaeon]
MQTGIVTSGAVLEIIKKETDGLKIANETKELIIEYLEKKLYEDLKTISKWAKELAELQEKKTIQTKDWEFIMKML